MAFPVLGVSGASSIVSLTLTGVDGCCSARGGNKRLLAPYFLNCEAEVSQSLSFVQPSCYMILLLSCIVLLS
jgi:hypothetical protein